MLQYASKNGVEGIPPILRRRYHINTIPVRGLVCSKIWFLFKIEIINSNRKRPSLP
jgi:hypothetical protein